MTFHHLSSWPCDFQNMNNFPFLVFLNHVISSYWTAPRSSSNHSSTSQSPPVARI
jgi:hypothetical protein